MQNISLSLLAGLPMSLDNSTTLRTVDTTCELSGVRFKYNRMRLLGVYLVAGSCTAVVVLFGFFAVSGNNGVEETLNFSRILGSGVDIRDKVEELDGGEGRVDLRTRVMAEDMPFGSLVPAPAATSTSRKHL